MWGDLTACEALEREEIYSSISLYPFKCLSGGRGVEAHAPKSQQEMVQNGDTTLNFLWEMVQNGDKAPSLVTYFN